MNIAEAILSLYPNADPVADFEVRDDGKGPWLARWDEAKLGPRPTEQQLVAARLPALKARKVAEIRAGVVRDCEAIMPVYEFIYITRARIADTRITQLEAIAKRGRDLEAYVSDPKRTEAEVTAVAW